MITKKFGVDFESPGGALTLPVSAVSVDPDVEGGTHERTHESGWTIRGAVIEDYFTWVNEFTASHPQHGNVWGDFEAEVCADSEEGFQHFYQNHAPEEWDYMEI